MKSIPGSQFSELPQADTAWVAVPCTPIAITQLPDMLLLPSVEG